MASLPSINDESGFVAGKFRFVGYPTAICGEHWDPAGHYKWKATVAYEQASFL